MTQIQAQVKKRKPKNIGMATSNVGVSSSMIISNSNRRKIQMRKVYPAKRTPPNWLKPHSYGC